MVVDAPYGAMTDEQKAILDLITSSWNAIQMGGDRVAQEFGFRGVDHWLSAKCAAFEEAGGSPTFIQDVIWNLRWMKPLTCSRVDWYEQARSQLAAYKWGADMYASVYGAGQPPKSLLGWVP